MSEESERTLELADIYRTVSDGMAAVEERIKSYSEVDATGLSELLDYGLRGGGKRIRPMLAFLSGKHYDYSLDRLIPIAMAVEVMHLATLVHDDTIDNSSVRWGRATINKLWGSEQAVLLGDYLFAQAGELIATTDNLRVIKLLPKTLMVISGGEITQARSAFDLDQTRINYFDRISSKTASLFVLATESGAILSNAPEHAIQILVDYGHNLGIAFQIIDDILDFIGTEEEMGKPVGSDLSQGTLTLPSMLLLERYPDDNPVRKLFESGGDEQYIVEAIDQIRNSKIIHDCFEIAADYRDQACRHLGGLPESDASQSMRDLADFVVSRRR
jgi:geranylgeranyl pyrophosphate synthase